MDQDKNLIVIVGPTAVGKTKLCIDLAKRFGMEIVSADSRQFYQEMTIGTAKPTAEEMEGVPHHFIDNLSVDTTYNVGQYEREALRTLSQIFQNANSVILTGGSGMYIDAVCKGVDEMPEIPHDIRHNLNELFTSEGIAPLVDRLKTIDSQYYHQVDRNNPQRVMRALEVYEATGKPYSLFRKGSAKTRPFNIIKIGLEREREELYKRINLRVDMMIDQGLFEEAKSLYPYKSNNALQTVGYKEVYGYLDGEYDKQEAIRLLKRNSRRYAKRQMTWFGKDEEIRWFHPEEERKITSYLKSLIG